MSGLRSVRLLAGTALALILAGPRGALAQEATQTAAVVATSPAVQLDGDKSSAPPVPATEQQAPTVEPMAAPPADAVTPGEAPPPDPLASLDPADRPVAEKIRDILAAKSDGIFASRNERAAVEAFYQGRNLASLWLDKGVLNERAKAAIARLQMAEADGLEVSDYRTPKFDGLSTDALAEAELKLTQKVLTFARHLQAGRFPYSRMSRNIQLPQVAPEPAAILAKMATAEDVGKALDEFSPPQEAYRRLKAKLAELRGKSAGAEHPIADGPLLKLNGKNPMQDDRLPSLRARLGLSGNASDHSYDASVAAAVQKFQQANELPDTGNLDARTVKALNGGGGHARQIELTIANMERWRWYPRDLGANHVVVNEPDFMLKVVHDGAQIWTTKVVIGDVNGGKQTPLLSESMKSITVNPTWNVPPSILYGEYLPALARDPTVLARMGLSVSYGRDGSVVHVSQPPGGNNVLGRLRFNFPNRFLVYQHDTNEKFMFAHEVRTFSHGCMRVQDPAKYAEVLLNLARPNEHWTAERVLRMYGEQDLQLPPTAIWVHVTYQSAFVDDAGRLQLRHDVYGLDSRTIAAIKTERGMIETLPESSKPEQEVASASGPRHKVAAPRPMSFFEAFFGGGARQARPPRGVYR